MKKQRPWMLLVGLLPPRRAGAAVSLGVGIALCAAGCGKPAEPTAANTPPAPEASGSPRPERQARPARVVNAGPAETDVPQAAPSAPPIPPDQPGISQPPPSAETQAMVAGLTRIEPGPMTPEQVTAWRRNFEQLVQQGPAAVGAIRQFLAQNLDFGFGESAGHLGYVSARTAMLDALGRIGGAEAAEALSGVLNTTADPRELAVVARNLEQIEPGRHTGDALAAATEALNMAASGGLGQRDVAPLFEILQQYGTEANVPTLEQASKQWGYYATVALANLPNGAGVPSLLRMANPSTATGDRTVAMQMVAQLASAHPTAREFLLQQTRSAGISASLWAYLRGPLSGDQYFPVDAVLTKYPALDRSVGLKTTRIPYGNQNLYMLPGEVSLTPEGVNQHLSLVNDLMAATQDPAALAVLQQTKEALAKRADAIAPKQ